MRQFSAPVTEKAERIVNAGHVRSIVGSYVWRVEGDTGSYVVGVDPTSRPVEHAACSCPHGQSRADGRLPAYCSHVAAVLLAWREGHHD